jgi:pimeloyl-ACP methyl ester carboxylesterase
VADFVLLHGSGQNAGCWDRVGSLLAARRHAVAAPNLPKHAPDWQLGDFAAEIARSVVRPHSVVVGHSFSGVFLPLVAQVSPCGLLVFLAAVIPEPGKSVRDQFAEDPGMFARDWIEAGPRWFDSSQRETLAEEFLFHDCDQDTLPWALSTVELFDTRHLVTQPAPFTTWPGVPTASIVATDDRTLTANWGRRVSLRVLGREAAEIGAGHCPHVSQPAAVADILEQLVARHSERRATC